MKKDLLNINIDIVETNNILDDVLKIITQSKNIVYKSIDIASKKLVNWQKN